MADSKIEAILKALKTALLATGAVVQRNAALPTSVTSAGLLILRDGTAGEPVAEYISPLAYEYDHEAQLEIFVQGTATRDAAFDALKQMIGPIIAANRTLGGLCDWIEAGAPEEVTDLSFEGAAAMKAATIPIIIRYVTTDPLA